MLDNICKIYYCYRDQHSDSIRLNEEIKSLIAINAVLNDQLETLINNEDRLNNELCKEKDSIISCKSENFDNTQEIFTFVEQYCTNEECKRKMLEEITKMAKFESFDMQAIDKCFDQISINIIRNHFNNDANNNDGRNQFSFCQLKDLNKIVGICTSKAKQLDTLLKKNKIQDSLNEIDSELNKLVKSRDKTYEEFKASQESFKSMNLTYMNKINNFDLNYFKGQEDQNKIVNKIENQIEESLKFIYSASLSTDKLMGDICNSKMETGNNISTILKNFKNAENIIIHIDKNINNLNKGIDDSSSSLLPRKVKLQKEICDSITQINSEIDEFNQAKQKYDKFKKGFVDKKFKLNKAIITFNEKKKLLGEINKSYPKVEEQLELMEQQLDKELDIEEDADFYTTKAQYKKCSIIVRKNDLTLERTDAIVNPANEDLKHFGGAAKAIADKEGKVIWNESKSYLKGHKKLYTGTAMVTNAGELSCGYVIHAVGPKYDENDSETANQKMIQVIESILQLMIDYDFKSVSIPGISIGIYRFPLKDAAKLMCKTTKLFIDKHKSEMKGRLIIFCNFDDKITDAFIKYVSMIFPSDEESNPEPDDSVPNPPRCSNCNRKIKDTSHQKKGKHLDICLKCYEKLKGNKVYQRDKSDDYREEVKESRIKLTKEKQTKSPKFEESCFKKKNRDR